VEPSENGKNFDLHLKLDLTGVPKRDDTKVLVQPFNVKSKPDPARLNPGEVQEIVFQNLGEVELSRFLHFRIEGSDDQAHHEFLFRIEIDNLPKDRLENILRRIIDSTDKFFEYLRFLLADDVTKEDLLAMGEEDPPPSSSGDEVIDGWHANLPIYEQLLVVASRSPHKLGEVDELIRHLASTQAADADEDADPTVIPEAFLSFWEAFRNLIPEKETKPL
jgi:hypothetical protein